MKQLAKFLNSYQQEETHAVVLLQPNFTVLPVVKLSLCRRRQDRRLSSFMVESDTITKVNLPKMNATKDKAKSSSQNFRDVTKYLGQAQCKIDIAISQGIR